MRGYRGTHSIIAFLIILPIASMLSAIIAFATFTSTESVRVYLAIAIFVCINMVYKQITKLVKDA